MHVKKSCYFISQEAAGPPYLEVGAVRLILVCVVRPFAARRAYILLHRRSFSAAIEGSPTHSPLYLVGKRTRFLELEEEKLSFSQYPCAIVEWQPLDKPILSLIMAMDALHTSEIPRKGAVIKVRRWCCVRMSGFGTIGDNETMANICNQ